VLQFYCTFQQVCVRLPTSADNVTLLTFADERRVAVRRAPLPIDISCPPGPQQQTRHSGMQLSINGTDRQTDRHTDVQTDTIPYGPCRAVSTSRRLYREQSRYKSWYGDRDS